MNGGFVATFKTPPMPKQETSDRGPCGHAVKDKAFEVGRICDFDGGYCQNWSKPELIDSCPTLRKAKT